MKGWKCFSGKDKQKYKIAIACIIINGLLYENKSHVIWGWIKVEAHTEDANIIVLPVQMKIDVFLVIVTLWRYKNLPVKYNINKEIKLEPRLALIRYSPKELIKKSVPKININCCFVNEESPLLIIGVIIKMVKYSVKNHHVFVAIGKIWKNLCGLIFFCIIKTNIVHNQK